MGLCFGPIPGDHRIYIGEFVGDSGLLLSELYLDC